MDKVDIKKFSPCIEDHIITNEILKKKLATAVEALSELLLSGIDDRDESIVRGALEKINKKKDKS